MINRILNFLFNTEYWSEYQTYNKAKDVLSTFFLEGEDSELQHAFVKDFDYPENMVEAPVRFEKNFGDIYYIINFKSKELFNHEETKHQAYQTSLRLLDKHLPFEITNYIEPQPIQFLPDSFSMLCSFRLLEDVSTKTYIKKLSFTIATITSLVALISIPTYLYIFPLF